MTTTQRHSPARSADTIARGLGAIAALAVILVGVPVALVVLAPMNLPTRLPTWDEAVGVWTRPDDGSVVWGIMTVAAWACWLVFTTQVIASLVSQVRHVELPAWHGAVWLQRAASSLIAAVVLMVTTPSVSMSAGNAAPIAAVVEPRPQGPTASVADRATRLDRGPAAGVGRPSPSSRAPVPVAPVADPHPDVVDAHPLVVVAPNDTLWDLAERHLGSGPRYSEIAALNAGVPQADGRALTDAHWIYAGWVLRLPMDAVDLPAVPPAAAASGPGGVHVVVPGDTLWGIADTHLGDGARYTEIADLNAGVPQPDGATLTDPDLIRPGWQLTLPGDSPLPDPSVDEAALEPALPVPSHRAGVEAEVQPPTVVVEGGEDLRNDAAAGVEGDLEADAAPGPSTSLVLGVTGLAAALLVGELARRRARQRRLRRLGERVPIPATGSPAEAVERELRRAVPPLTLDQLDGAMRRVAAGARAQGRALPRIQAVLVGVDEVELLLAHEDADVVSPFTAVAPDRWRAANGDLVDDDGARYGDNPYSDLVSVGLHGTRILLINLEAAGTLSIVGDPAMSLAALRAIACELACRRFDVRIAPNLTDELSELLDNDDPNVLAATAPDPVVYRQTHASNVRSLEASGFRDVLDARREPEEWEGWLTTVHVGSPVPDLTANPWSGFAVVATGDHDGWRLIVDPDGAARLDPLSLDLAVAHLAEPAWRGLVESLRAARQVPSRGYPAEPLSVPEQFAVASESLDPAPGPSLDDLDTLDLDAISDEAAELDARAPRILLLGRPTVLFGDATATTPRERRLTEIVAFLALHPGASAEALDALLGRGRRVTNSSRNAYISRARAWLGHAPDGTPYLPLLTGRDDYRLHPAVRTDWDDFRDLLRAGVQAEADGAPALRAALDLVRARPFADVPVGTYDWAEPSIHQMIDQIVDSAHLYSVLAGESDYRSVQEALAIALSVDPCNELLYRDAIAAAHRVGDTDEVDRLVDRLHQRIQEIDPEDVMEAETQELVRRVTLRRR